MAAELAAEVKALIDDAQDVIDARHLEEAAELQERIERYGQRGSGKRDVEERHKREVRRHRTAELRFALATFAAAYRDALADARRPDRGGRRPAPHRRRRAGPRALPQRGPAAAVVALAAPRSPGVAAPRLGLALALAGPTPARLV